MIKGWCRASGFLSAAIGNGCATLNSLLHFSRHLPNLIKTTQKDSVLEIEIPKPEEEQPKQITVKVE